MTRVALPLIVIASVAVLALVCLLSLMLGLRIFGPGEVLHALTHPATEDLAGLILRDTRLPRMLAALAVGAGLGLSGSILQTVTRNLLADPGLLGVNAGAALAVVLVTALAPAIPALSTLGLVAIAGAALTGMLVYLLAGGASAFGARPLRLILSGGVMAMMLGSLTGIVLLMQPGAFEATQVWLAGSVADRSAAMVGAYLPFMAVLVAAGLAMAPALSLLLLGEAQGRALGANVVRLRGASVAIAAGLCGLSVSLAGPIAFVGLIAPHLARGLGGPRPAMLFGLSVIWGAILVLAADILARLVVAPAELPVGLVLAALGVPFYLFLLRRPIMGEP